MDYVRAELAKEHEGERTALTDEIERLRNDLVERSDELSRVREERDSETGRREEVENLYSNVLTKLAALEEEYMSEAGEDVSGIAESQEKVFQLSGSSEANRTTVHQGVTKGKGLWIYAGISLAAVIIVTALIFTYNALVREERYTGSPLKPVITDTSKKTDYSVSYTPITDSRVSGNMKFRATMISEALLAKENAGGDQSWFDFRKFYYFRVHITAMDGSLDRELVINPVSHVQLTDGKKRVSPDMHSERINLRTIYKRDVPVSVSFLCIFPKGVSNTAPEKIKLLISSTGNPVQLSWKR
jgi:hypothetical protein